MLMMLLTTLRPCIYALLCVLCYRQHTLDIHFWHEDTVAHTEVVLALHLSAYVLLVIKLLCYEFALTKSNLAGGLVEVCPVPNTASGLFRFLFPDNKSQPKRGHVRSLHM